MDLCERRQPDDKGRKVRMWVDDVEVRTGWKVFDVKVDADRGTVIASTEDIADADDGSAVDSCVGACPCRRTGFHFAGTCARPIDLVQSKKHVGGGRLRRRRPDRQDW
jgi:hypothetical protein